MRALGLTPENTPALRETKFYTSHEALLLGYEEALTRREFDHQRLVRDLRPHAVDRRPHPPARWRPCRVFLPASTIRSASSAARRLTSDDLLRLLDGSTRPTRPGRITLIGRFGADKVARAPAAPDRGGEARPGAPSSGAPIRCTATPIKASTGYKTRAFDRVLSEVQRSSRSTARWAPMPAASISR